MNSISGRSDSVEDRILFSLLIFRSPWIKRILCEHTSRYTTDPTSWTCMQRHINVQ